jgi:cytochrome c oxidase subunit 2
VDGETLAELPHAQSLREPAGPHAEAIAALFDANVLFLAAVWLAVGIAIALALRSHPEDERSPRRHALAVAAATVATTLAVFALLGANIATGRRVDVSEPRAPLTLRVTGTQWWWEIVYEDPVPSRRVTTANELWLPVGEPVTLLLETRDVIHSFWVPRLGGKADLVPGQVHGLRLQADEPGTFRGQCAEFCGLQHANMALLVEAVPRARFDAWLEAQRAPAREPVALAARRGREVFLSRGCPLCHSVRGTPAQGRAGPDLTHLASRRTLAAGALPNTKGHLAGWIVAPHRQKPGNEMPPMELPANELEPLLAYLRGLE